LEPSAWDAFVDAHPQGWVWHTSYWLDYLKARPSGCHDASHAVVDAYGVAAIVPALLPVPPDDPLPPFLSLKQPAAGYPTGPGLPARFMPQQERTRYGFETSVIDLAIPALWANVRKSYHAIIHRAEERLTVHCCNTVDPLRALYKERADLKQITDDQWVMLQLLVTAGHLRI
jgi:hypothetical protein